MAHRCRVCGEPHHGPDERIAYPSPPQLAALDPLIIPLLQAAREFDALGHESAVAFVQWLATDTKKAAELRGVA